MVKYPLGLTMTAVSSPFGLSVLRMALPILAILLYEDFQLPWITSKEGWRHVGKKRSTTRRAMRCVFMTRASTFFL
jgi:hypothetical protein